MKGWSLRFACDKDQANLLDLYHREAVLFLVDGEQLKGFKQIASYLTSKYLNIRMDFIPHFKEMNATRGYEYGIMRMIESDAEGLVYEGHYSIVWLHSEVTSWRIISQILS